MTTPLSHDDTNALMRSWSMYFMAQTLGCALWWAAIISSDQVAALFAPARGVETLRAFWLADLVCVVGGSALCAFTLHAHHRLMIQALWWTGGSITFATLYCVAVWIDTQQGLAAVALMAPATLLTLIAAQQCSHTSPHSP